ncbi:MAG: hypothetical protein ACLUEK_07820 [Oscillospiraceae bacterium]
MRTHTKKTAFDYIIIVILLAVCFACIYPMWYIGVNSFAAPEVVNRGLYLVAFGLQPDA